MGDINLKPVSTREGGVLTALWRNILRDKNLMPALDYLVTRYVAKNDNTQGRVAAMKKKTKSSLIKNLTDSEMTFKTFLDLVFNFINVKKISITIKLTHPNGDESLHSISVENPGTGGSDEEA